MAEQPVVVVVIVVVVTVEVSVIKARRPVLKSLNSLFPNMDFTVTAHRVMPNEVGVPKCDRCYLAGSTKSEGDVVGVVIDGVCGVEVALACKDDAHYSIDVLIESFDEISRPTAELGTRVKYRQ